MGEIVPRRLEIAAIAGLFLLYLLMGTVYGDQVYAFANVVGPLALTAILCAGAWLMVKRNGRTAWTALFWFRISTAAYFGVGTYIVFILNDYTRLSVEAFFAFFDADVFKMNLVVTLSVALVLGAARLAFLLQRRIGWQRRHPAVEGNSVAGPSDRSMLVTALVFLITGAVINYLFLVPYQFGWTETVLPGTVGNLAPMRQVGLFLVTLWALRNRRSLLPAIIALATIDMLLDLAQFAKSGILMSLIMLSMAFLWEKVTLRRAAFFGALILGTYFVLQPLVAFARAEIGSRYGVNTQAGFGERIEILKSYVTEGGIEAAQERENMKGG